MLFLSTPSARRATGCSTTTTPSQTYFYPRPPRGGRRAALRLLHPRRPISIHALREEGDLHFLDLATGHELISIHALREEGDRCTIPMCFDLNYFYPRPPRGGRQLRSATLSSRSVFLSTPSARRATGLHPAGLRRSRISIHALREEGDPVFL